MYLNGRSVQSYLKDVVGNADGGVVGNRNSGWGIAKGEIADLNHQVTCADERPCPVRNYGVRGALADDGHVASLQRDGARIGPVFVSLDKNAVTCVGVGRDFQQTIYLVDSLLNGVEVSLIMWEGMLDSNVISSGRTRCR